MGKDRRNETLRALGLITQLGVTMAVCVFIGVALGRYLDSVFGTSPWFLLGMSLLGVAAAFKSMFDMILRK